VSLLLGGFAGAATHRLSVTGVDQPGAAAYRTFGYAISRLDAGDTLEMGSGTWSFTDGGLTSINCSGGNARSGNAQAPITVRAEKERTAVLSGDGRAHALSVSDCDYWVFEGLTVQTADMSSSTTGGGVYLSNASHTVLRRMLVVGSNRYGFGTAISVSKGDHTLVEECEVYDFVTTGINLSGDNDIARRNYVNSRGRKDLSGGLSTQDPERGDTGILLRGNSQLCENNITEGNSTGVGSYTTSTQTDLRFIGNVSLSDRNGVLVSSATADFPSRDVVVRNQVSVNSSINGVWLRNSINSKTDHCSLLGSQGQGFLADPQGSDADGGSLTSAFLSDSLAAFFPTGSGFFFSVRNAQAVNVNAFATNKPFTPANAFSLARQLDPNLGACKVFIPDGTPMKGLGLDGGDIGASVLFRTENGLLTQQPLWDPATGAFPCGQKVPGINDRDGISCFDVHQRLAVGVNGCPLPDAYKALADGGKTGDGGTTGTPVARLNPSSRTVQAGENLTLDASSSTASAGATLVAFDWDQPRGPTGVSLSQGSSQTLTFAEPGRYVFRLVVRDSAGRTSAPVTVSVEVNASRSSCSQAPGAIAPILFALLLIRRKRSP
jgi:hypothetical protein